MTRKAKPQITDVPGQQLQCQCSDCRRAIVWLGQPDPGPEGLRYFQTSPSWVTFDGGLDQLAAFKWKDGRLLRWYAACCNTPMINTLDSAKWAFASILVSRLSDPDALGPCTTRAFVPKPNGKQGFEKMGGFLWGFAKRVTTARLTGRWRDTPFFDFDNRPISAPQVLTKADRATVPMLSPTP